MVYTLKILLITGKLAEEIVKSKIRESKTKHMVDVLVLPVQVIALLSTHDIARILKRKNITRKDYDLVIIPGLCRGSATEIYKETGVPAVKGTIHAHDIPLILELDDPSQLLSPDKPADEILSTIILEHNKKLLYDLEQKIKNKSIMVGKTRIPYKPPPIRVVSEIPNAHILGKEELLEKTRYYVENGADIIGVGFEPLNPQPDKVYEIISFLKKETDLTIAIDTLIPVEIEAGLKAGADLVLSIDLCNSHKTLSILKEYEKPFVIIPYDSCKNYLPPQKDRLALIEKIVREVESKGLVNYIIDPILNPPITGNLLGSLNLYKITKEKYPDKPLLMGTGNVSELVDVDSIGVNALLVFLALEAGVSMVLTVEHSVKTQGSTRELVIASQMASLAYLRKTPPKDLGIDLLVVKDKKRIDIPLETENAKVIELTNQVSRDENYELDPMGVFKIRVNYGEGLIEALYIGRKGRKLIKSRDDRLIANYIVRENLVSTIPHAIYLGRELAKAREALILNKNYVQEKPLFTRKEFIRINSEAGENGVENGR